MSDSNERYKFSSDFMQRLTNAWKDWIACRRCYKWFSFLPLLIATAFGNLGFLLFKIGCCCMIGGFGCSEVGDEMGVTVTYEVDHTGKKTEIRRENNGTCCYLIALVLWCYGAFVVIYGTMLICAGWAFLLLSCTSCYEQVRDDAPKMYYVLRLGVPVEDVIIRPTMNRHVWKSLGTITSKQVIYAQYVYTGWLRIVNESGTEEEDEKWVYCHRYASMIFEGFETKEAAEKYLEGSVVTQQEMVPPGDIESGNAATSVSKEEPVAANPLHSEPTPSAEINLAAEIPIAVPVDPPSLTEVPLSETDNSNQV